MGYRILDQYASAIPAILTQSYFMAFPLNYDCSLLLLNQVRSLNGEAFVTVPDNTGEDSKQKVIHGETTQAGKCLTKV
jgi:hypothetical protein